MESMRSVGYSLPTAIADLIDNSITAGAASVWVDMHWNGRNSWVSVRDDGKGMNEQELVRGMRAGSINPTAVRNRNDLGRFGLGLKTASFSQCRRLTVWSKQKDSAPSARRWDLDYVAEYDEWRLLGGFESPEIDPLKRWAVARSGTVVLWENMDTLDHEGQVTPENSQQRFLEHVREVAQHLSMVFHRYMEQAVSPGGKKLSITVNGNPLKPWNPFHAGSRVLPERSPVEKINCLHETVEIQGYVLPHHDKLTPEEFQAAAGPKGWNAQQGFYLYRNHRLIIAGSWLQLGPPGRPWYQEEQYRLARLRIEIGNTNDFEWGLDVKKATAHPPAALCSRLAGLADRQRKRAKEVFVHRGQYGPRPEPGAATLEHPWHSSTRAGRQVYRINRQHPLIKAAGGRMGPLAAELNAVLRLVEETVPVERIWIDAAESECDHAQPYEGLNESQLRADLRMTYAFLVNGGVSASEAITQLRVCEPFNRHPALIDQLKDEHCA